MSQGKTRYQLAPTIIYFFILLCIAVAYILVASTVDATNTFQSTSQVSTQSATVQILSTSQDSQIDHSSQTNSSSSSASAQQQNASGVTEISNTSTVQTDPTVGQVGNSAETIGQVQTSPQQSPIALWTAIAFAAVTVGYLVYSLRPSTRQ